MKNNLKFVKVQKNKEHVDVLYNLLKNRNHTISHQTLPNYSQHEKFVKNHPYRVWFLIEDDGQFIGSVYILKNNSIGIPNIENAQKNVKLAIEYIMKKYKPLAAIPSVRSPHFTINVAPDNVELKKAVEAMNTKMIQVTYAF